MALKSIAYDTEVRRPRCGVAICAERYWVSIERNERIEGSESMRGTNPISLKYYLILKYSGGM